MFDEERRSRLLAAYRALPDLERRLCRFLAVLYVPTAVSNLMKCLNASAIYTPLGIQWGAKVSILPFLERWRDAGLTDTVPVRNTVYWYLDRLLAEPLAREALALGEFRAFDQAVDETMGFSREESGHFYVPSLSRVYRSCRNAIYEGDVERYRGLSSRKYGFMGDCYGPDHPCDPLTDIAANPLDADFLMGLEPAVGEHVFFGLLHNTMGEPEVYRRVADAFFAYCRGKEIPPRMRFRFAERLFMHGRAEEARAELSGQEDPDAYALRAFIAFTERGDEAEAIAIYEAGLKVIRGLTGKRSAAFVSWPSILYPVLLFKAGEGRKKVAAYIRKAYEWSEGYPEVILSLLWKALSFGREGIDEYENSLLDTPYIEDPRHDWSPISFFALLFSHWTLPVEEDRALAETAGTVAGLLGDLGLDYFRRELLEIYGGKGERPGLPHPLGALLGRKDEWERSLSELQGIGGSPERARTGSNKRLVWEIDWNVSKGRVRALTVTPVEQTLQKRGWSKGRHVALRRLYRKADTVLSLTDQDHRVASAIRESRDFYGTEYFLDVPQAVFALAGHPLLVRAGTGERVEVFQDEPRLSVRDAGEGYELRVAPFPDPDAPTSFAFSPDGPNRLRATRFEDRHLRMAQIVGRSGLKLPKTARDALLRTLGSLASVVTIHSDLEGLETDAQTVKADGRLCVQIQPAQDGLDVDAVVRPLGPGSAPCRPGRGGANLFGSQDGRRVQAQRDLGEEREGLRLLRERCPALAEGEQAADEKWRLPDAELALEFLVQLGEMGDAVTVEWPKGQSMRVAAVVSEGSLNVSVREAGDWFGVSGELRVREDLVLNMRALLERMRSGLGRFIPLGDGEFLALTREFRRRLEALGSLGDARGEEIRVAPLAAGLAAELVEGAGRVDAGPEWRALLDRVAEAERIVPVLPPTFRGELREYQAEGFAWLSRLAHWGAGACLADDMGLGKTIQTLALLVARGAEGPALVVAPTSVCANWLAESARFAPTLNVLELRHGDRERMLAELGPMDLVVTSYGILQNEVERFAEVRWSTVVLDEAQAIKNMGTKRSGAVMKLNAAFRMATTGTPVENRLSELWSLFRFLNPHYLGSFESFNRRFAVPIERDGDRGARQRLRRMIQPFILRRTKEQVLEELPSKTEITLRVEMREEEFAFYEALRRAAVDTFADGGAAEDRRLRIFAELMKLRRACCNASLVEPGLRLPSAKQEAFLDILAELRAGGHKALVFSQFVGHLAILRDCLEREGVPYQYLDGATPPDERRRRVAAFQAGEGDCFLISLKAGGTGLNLTAADYVVHMDPWWNPAVEEQASDRAHRIGQERPVTVYRIVAKNTVEERIVDLHAWKRDLAESLLEESDAAVRLSAEEMLALIRETR